MKRILTTVLSLLILSMIVSGAGFSASAAEQLESTTSTPVLTEWTYTGLWQGAELGYSVGSAGDVNGDKFADVIIGAPRYRVTLDGEGAALVFQGAISGLAENPSWEMGSGLQGSLFGSSVASAGDVNGDHYDDVIVGAPEYYHYEGTDKISKEGAVFVYYGSSLGLSETASWSYKSNVKDARIGVSVSSAGDVNQDGFDDVIVGAPNYSPLTSEGTEIPNAGAIFLFVGSSSGLSLEPTWVYTGTQAGGQVGYSVACAGDVNSDGHLDLIAGAPLFDNKDPELETPVLDAGAVLVFLGSDSGFGENPDWLMTGIHEGSSFGHIVSGMGDINGDEIADVAIGAPSEELLLDTGGILYGAAYLFHGSSAGLGSEPDNVLRNTDADSLDRFGDAVSFVGDVNDDGVSDLLVGAYLYGTDSSTDPDEEPDEGRAYLYLGGASGVSAFSTWSGEGGKADAHLGFAVGAAGDINNDGYDDLITGAPNYKQDEKPRGRAVVYFGTEIMTSGFSVYLPLVISGR